MENDQTTIKTALLADVKAEDLPEYDFEAGKDQAKVIVMRKETVSPGMVLFLTGFVFQPSWWIGSFLSVETQTDRTWRKINRSISLMSIGFAMLLVWSLMHLNQGNFQWPGRHHHRHHQHGPAACPVPEPYPRPAPFPPVDGPMPGSDPSSYEPVSIDDDTEMIYVEIRPQAQSRPASMRNN